MSSPDFEVRRRHLLVIATGTYADSGRWHALPVMEEVRVWTDWLTSGDLGDRRFTQVAPDLADDPSLPRLFQHFTEQTDLIRASDALVVLVTGHGTVKNRVHRIVLKNAVSGREDTTMLRTDQLIGFLRDTQVQHALVVIDTCHAGEVTRQMLFDQPLPPGWIGIAAAAPTGQARSGAVSGAVRTFLNLDRAGGKNAGPESALFRCC